MTGEPVLIAALAGRGLAASARRAGYAPLVADAFGDADTAEHAEKAMWVADAARIGFRTKPLLAALDTLAASARTPPIGLVLGSGFEDRPKLVAALARRFRLIGNDAETIQRAKSPAALFPLLDILGIAHASTRLSLPESPEGWLSKRIGGSGGTHIVAASASMVGESRRYYQQRLDGEPASMLVAVSGGTPAVIGCSRQWPVGSGPRPYRYGGAAGPADLSAAAESAMREAVGGLCDSMPLRGLVSFDFILVGGRPHLLEINPRPGATLDIFDDATGSLFHAHVASSQGRQPLLPAIGGARAAGILYADARPLDVPPVAWPAWTADRPHAGSRVARYRPIATVFAAAATAQSAFHSCRRRLDELGRMLYAQAPNRERHDNGEVQRPRTERLGARRPAR